MIEDHGSEEDPAGGVRLPPSRREIVRTYALAGLVLGTCALLGVTTPFITPSSITGPTS